MKWFKEKELCCKCCGQLPPFARENIEALVENVLDPLRERYGKPIVVNSGYRCAKHNKEVGGVANSQHVKGEAADIRPTTKVQLDGPEGKVNFTNYTNKADAWYTLEGVRLNGKPSARGMYIHGGRKTVIK